MSDHYTVPRFVYFVRPVGQNGPVKIGTSTLPERRLGTLAAWSPVPLEIVTTAVGSFPEEQRLHGVFAKDHSHKEWFNYTPHLGEVMDRVKAGESIDSIVEGLESTGTIRSRDYSLSWPDSRKAYMAWLSRLRAAARRAKEEMGVAVWMPDEIDDLVQSFFEQRRAPTPEEEARLRAICANPTAHCQTYEQRFGKRRQVAA